MKTVIWIPYRDTHVYRKRAFAMACAQAQTLPFQVLSADSGDEPFSIARTWNLLSEISGDWDKAVRWGADFLMVDPSSVIAAVETDAPWVYAFDTYRRLTDLETKRLLRTGKHTPTRDPDPLPPGGVSVISRELWEGVGGMDPRFVGWGHEDRVLTHSRDVLFGAPLRVAGEMLNLAHPRRHELPDHAYYANQRENRRMLKAFQAITDPTELALEIAEIRAAHRG
jgi:hypothetical protein